MFDAYPGKYVCENAAISIVRFDYTLSIILSLSLSI